jgi:glycerate kinase
MAAMRVLVAFDKFKDALSARQACEVAASALRAKHPEWQIDACALSDGGDGFEDVLTASTPAKHERCTVTGPRGFSVDAGFSLVAKSQIPPAAASRLKFADGADPLLAIVEMATASGLALLPPAQRNPWETTSRGTGQLIRAAAEAGAKAILLGVGGSATHDLGLGALSALGFDFCDAAGTPVRPPIPSRWESVTKIVGEISSSIPPLHIACDVTNPLLGPQGAAAIFAPQKGLHADELAALETASEQMAQRLCAHCRQPLTLPGTPGTGAAGGIAFGLMCAARAELIPGYALVADWLDLKNRIHAADLVITGEGRFDSSSLRGKGPGAVISQALAARKRVSVFAGQIVSATTHDLLSLQEISPTDVPLDRALRDAAVFLRRAVERAF